MFDNSTVNEIQKKLREYNYDGWLLYNFRNCNVFATKILDMPTDKIQFDFPELYFSPDGRVLWDFGNLSTAF